MNKMKLSILLLCLMILTVVMAKNEQFEDLSNGTIKDNKTSNIWQKGHSPEMLIWEAAKSYCSNLKLANKSWKLPTIDELNTLSTRKKKNGYYMPEVFDNKDVDYDGRFWTNTAYAKDGNFAWYVRFTDGDSADKDAKTNKNEVRCLSLGD